MAGSAPQRGRSLIPAGLPHRREAVAVCAILVLLVHLLLAQLTLVLALSFALITGLSRWRLWWLVLPAAAGLVLALAVGPGRATTGFAVSPAHVLEYLGRTRPAVVLAHPLGAFAGAGSRLPGQLPIALLAGAAEAALIGWLDRTRTGARAAPRRPGVLAAARGVLTARLIGAGGVVTRTGCALGVLAATGAVAELPWSQVTTGTLVVGASAQEATITSLQVVHAALRRRKPLVVIDAGDDPAVARAVAAACRATRTPLRPAGTDLGAVIGERAAMLVAVRSPGQAIGACDQLTALAAHLRGIGVDGDGLIWVPCGERLPARSLRTLIRASGAVGLGVLITTSSAAAAAELAGVAGALLVHRVADPTLAASLAARTGTRLRPAAAPSTRETPTAATLASAEAGLPAMFDAPAFDAPAFGTARASRAMGGTAVADLARSDPAAFGALAPAGLGASSVGGLVPGPAIEAQTLLTLGPGRFVLTVAAAGQPTAVAGRVVLARLPREDAGAPGEPTSARAGSLAARSAPPAGPRAATWRRS